MSYSLALDEEGQHALGHRTEGVEGPVRRDHDPEQQASKWCEAGCPTATGSVSPLLLVVKGPLRRAMTLQDPDFCCIVSKHCYN
jgi:hypothetical protein